jgi:DNA mismatch repair protein MutS2
VVAAGRVSAVEGAEPARPAPRVSIERSAPAADAEDSLAEGRCDLHGMRVDDALDRVASALDLAASMGQIRIVILHGRGTGALRQAVRRYLADSPYVTRFAPGGPHEGGDGVTIAELA